jgi:thioredoxin-related protein
LIGGSQDALQRDYRIASTPTTYLLDQNGRVLFRADGYKPGGENILEAKIEAALNGRLTPTSTLRP